MELFKKETKIDFMGMRHFSAGFSIVLSLLLIIAVWGKGLNLGLDFSGGVEVEARLSIDNSLELLKKHFEKQNLEKVKLKYYGSVKDILVRSANSSLESDAALMKKITEAIKVYDPKAEILKTDIVGAEVGEDLTQKGVFAVFFAILATMIYIAIRFQYKLALSAALSLSHDAIIILGIFAIFQIEFDLSVLAAILAILGYSLNDTIVVFDRIRENFKKIRSQDTSLIINQSINQTLSRTIMTSFLTFLVSLSLLMFGGESLKGFSLVLCLGIIIGTYSSIYIASALALYLRLNRVDMLPKPKEVDNSP
ncbi:MAG: protein translocase subunit SecF [Gammaproteobacteria bacterium]